MWKYCKQRSDHNPNKSAEYAKLTAILTRYHGIVFSICLLYYNESHFNEERWYWQLLRNVHITFRSCLMNEWDLWQQWYVLFEYWINYSNTGYLDITAIKMHVHYDRESAVFSFTPSFTLTEILDNLIIIARENTSNIVMNTHSFAGFMIW